LTRQGRAIGGDGLKIYEDRCMPPPPVGVGPPPLKVQVADLLMWGGVLNCVDGYVWMVDACDGLLNREGVVAGGELLWLVLALSVKLALC
jgi:hypothetical protein